MGAPASWWTATFALVLLARLRSAAAGDILCVGDAWCYGKDLACKPDEDCVLTCSGDHACRRVTVRGPPGHKLTVDCGGKSADDPCKRMVVNATASSALAFNCDAVGAGCGVSTTIRCPRGGSADDGSAGGDEPAGGADGDAARAAAPAAPCDISCTADLSEALQLKRLTRFYAKYAPNKTANDTETVLTKYRGREPLLFAALHKKYGPEEPDPDFGAPPPWPRWAERLRVAVDHRVRAFLHWWTGTKRRYEVKGVAEGQKNVCFNLQVHAGAGPRARAHRVPGIRVGRRLQPVDVQGHQSAGRRRAVARRCRSRTTARRRRLHRRRGPRRRRRRRRWRSRRRALSAARRHPGGRCRSC